MSGGIVRVRNYDFHNFCNILGYGHIYTRMYMYMYVNMEHFQLYHNILCRPSSHYLTACMYMCMFMYGAVLVPDSFRVLSPHIIYVYMDICIHVYDSIEFVCYKTWRNVYCHYCFGFQVQIR